MSQETRFSLDEPRIVEDPASWLERNRAVVAVALVAVLLAAVGGGWWWQQLAAREAEAERLFADASTPADWKTLVERYPKTSPAPLALLQLASEARQRGALEESLDWTEQFLKAHPRHALRPAAELSRAMLWEALGKTAEARAAYESMRNARPTHPMAGAASVGLARLLLAEGNKTAARQVLSEFVAGDRDGSAFAAEANRMLRTLPDAAP
jgi:TolA-binding protein